MKVLATLFLLLLGSMSSASEVEWLYKEDVHYQENHDPSRIFLIDGRILSMTYNNISLQEMENWKKGKLLHIAYRIETGRVLLDPQSGKYIPIHWGLKEHPLDILYSEELEKVHNNANFSTLESRFADLWEQDMNRSYCDLLELYKTIAVNVNDEDRKSFKEEPQKLIDAQKEWVEFYEMQKTAINNFSVILYRAGIVGKLQLMAGSSMVAQLIRERANYLAALLGVFS